MGTSGPEWAVPAETDKVGHDVFRRLARRGWMRKRGEASVDDLLRRLGPDIF
ncbi:MAG: hypothetical protein HYV63_03665 [Candidatus Schekmanbacteria bacterium]|nr:hypothetical protein [Candidatus Schekmanbacteria bacterium]